MDWIKTGAIVVSVASGLREILRFFRAYRAMNQPRPNTHYGNGEITKVFRQIGEIHKRIDHVVARIDSIESRLST